MHFGEHLKFPLSNKFRVWTAFCTLKSRSTSTLFLCTAAVLLRCVFAGKVSWCAFSAEQHGMCSCWHLHMQHEHSFIGQGRGAGRRLSDDETWVAGTADMKGRPRVSLRGTRISCRVFVMVLPVFCSAGLLLRSRRGRDSAQSASLAQNFQHPQHSACTLTLPHMCPLVGWNLLEESEERRRKERASPLNAQRSLSFSLLSSPPVHPHNTHSLSHHQNGELTRRVCVLLWCVQEPHSFLQPPVCRGELPPRRVCRM